MMDRSRPRVTQSPPPLKSPSPIGDPVDDSTSAAQLESDPIRVLLVDDSADDRRTIRRLIQRAQWLREPVVREAATADEARRMFLYTPCDCLLIDYHLPGTNGLELLDSLPLEADGLPPDTILMTQDDDPQIVVEAMRLGVRDFLPKNQITPEAMLQAICRVMGHRRLRLQFVRQSCELERQNAVLREMIAECTKAATRSSQRS